MLSITILVKFNDLKKQGLWPFDSQVGNFLSGRTLNENYFWYKS